MNEGLEAWVFGSRANVFGDTRGSRSPAPAAPSRWTTLRLALFSRVLTLGATREEAGSRSSLRSSDEPSSGLALFSRVLTLGATREEAGSRSSLRSSDEPSSRLWSLQNTVLNRSQAQSIQWIDCWPAVNHVRREAPIRNPLRFASPQASARNRKTLSPRTTKTNNPFALGAQPTSSRHTKLYRAR